MSAQRVAADLPRVRGESHRNPVLLGEPNQPSNRNPILLGEPTEAKPVPPRPADRALPQLAELLDGRSVRRALREAGVAEVEDARPRYLRYKPENKALVLYDVSLSGRWTTAVLTIAAHRNLAKLPQAPDLIELADLVRGRTGAEAPVMFLDRLRALVEWFPLNRLIPGLALSPAWLSRRIASTARRLGAGGEPEPLAYKPERRAVSRWGELILKAYARRGDFEAAVQGFAAGRGVPGAVVPTLVDAIPEVRVTLQQALPGTPGGASDARALGRSLAALHGGPINSTSRCTKQDHLAAAAATCRHVQFLLPPLRHELDRLIARLRSTIPHPGPLVQAHGDFHADQALIADGAPALIDFDHACLAPAALDVATFAAHLIDGSEASVGSALHALDELLRGYGEPPRDLAWFLAVAILRRAALPFRSLAPDWPARITSLVHTAADLSHDRLGTP